MNRLADYIGGRVGVVRGAVCDSDEDDGGDGVAASVVDDVEDGAAV